MNWRVARCRPGADFRQRRLCDAYLAQSPDKIASRGMTAGDVVAAVREQNIQVSAGQLGAEPIAKDTDFLISINAQGRLRTAQEFGNVVLKIGRGKSSASPMWRALNLAPTTIRCADNPTIRTHRPSVFQAPGANALTVRDAVIAKMEELKHASPGLTYRSDYDTTVFVRDSIQAVVQTLMEAILLSCSLSSSFCKPGAPRSFR